MTEDVEERFGRLEAGLRAMQQDLADELEERRCAMGRVSAVDEKLQRTLARVEALDRELLQLRANASLAGAALITCVESEAAGSS